MNMGVQNICLSPLLSILLSICPEENSGFVNFFLLFFKIFLAASGLNCGAWALCCGTQAFSLVVASRLQGTWAL